MVAVPVMKLFSMTIKTLAKPMSKRIKTEAQKHPTFRGVLNRMGQATNNISARISIRMAGHTTTKIKPLEEDKAIADGGDLLAEGFIYGLGTFLMVFEYVSSAKEKEEKEAKAKLKKEQEKRELAQALEDVNNRLAKLEALGQRGVVVQAEKKDGESAPPSGGGGGGGSKVLGLSLPSAMPWWGRRRDDLDDYDPAGLRSEERSMQDTIDVSAQSSADGASAAQGTGSRSLYLSSGSCRSVLRVMEGSDAERVATGSATSAAQTDDNRR